MTPYDIDEKRFIEVIDLFSDIRRMQIREKKLSDPNRIIRKPAGDNWF